MDTLTHIVLGACIGEAIAGKQLGKKAIILGAVAQNIPDIDFVASFWLPTVSDVLAHRGFTHSILFALLVSPLLAYCSGRLFRSGGLSFGKWALFWGLQIFVHIFIDAFNVDFKLSNPACLSTWPTVYEILKPVSLYINDMK